MSGWGLSARAREEQVDGRPRRRAGCHRGPRSHGRPVDRHVGQAPGRALRGPARARKRATASSRRKCRKKAPTVRGDKAHLFKSQRQVLRARRPRVVGRRDDRHARQLARRPEEGRHARDLNATYETKLASWYESMGIMVAYMAEGKKGKNPFRSKVNHKGKVTHGHLRRTASTAARRPNCRTRASSPSGVVLLRPADHRRLLLPGRRPAPARAAQATRQRQAGQSLTYVLGSGDNRQETWHSVTSCKAPCNRSTGIAYPIPDAKYQFDSGQLGTGRPPSAGDVADAQGPARGHLHLLLPHPSVHARRLPRQAVAAAASASGR